MLFISLMVVTLSGDPAKDAFAPLSSLALRFTAPTTDPMASPPELPPPPENCDISALYAKVDKSKKRKNRESATSR